MDNIVTQQAVPGAVSVNSAAPWWKGDRFIALLFFAAVFAAYSHVFNGAFVWDDDAYISQNPWMRSLDGLHNIWFNTKDSGHQYYPLTFTIFWAAFQLWGLHPLGYHLIDIAFHALTSVLLWQVLKRLKVPGALLAGALFALYPVNVMSAGWMNELKNTFSGSLALASIWAYIRFEGLGVYEEASAGKRAWRWYALAIALFLLAMLAKTAVSFLPVTVLLIVWWKREKFGWPQIWPALPMVAVVAGMGLMTIKIEKTVSGATGDDFKLNFFERLIVSGHSFFFYIGKLLAPVHLSFVYTKWNINKWDARQYLWPLAAAAVLTGLWFARRRIGKAPWAAAMHFYISTSCLVFMVVLYRMRFSFVADHWIYFGSMSVFALMGAAFAWGLDFLAKRDIPGGPWLMGALLAALGAMTWHQCAMFNDFETLWHWTIGENPNCWMAENNLGNYLLDKRRFDESMGHLQKAIALKPDYVLAMNNLGKAYMFKNRVDDAQNMFQQAFKINPGDAETLNNLGGAAMEKNQLPEAIDYYEQAIKIKPNFILFRKNLADARSDYAKTLLRNHRVEDAMAQYRRVIEIAPNYLLALNDLAYLLATATDDRLRDGAKAVELASRANQLTQGRIPIILDILAAAYAEAGQFKQAVDTDWQAIARAVELKDTKHANLFRKHLELYQAGQPLRNN